MKYFMVCINPECDQPLHAVSGGELIVVANMGVPVITSINGDEPPVEAAITALECFLESDPEDKMKDMAYEKLKSLQVHPTEECTCPSCTEPKTSESMGGIAISPTASDDYYQSAEYKAHRVRMEELEVERTKAEILNQQAQTQLVEAKARLTNAEARKIELNFPPEQTSRRTSETN
ncbi:MAG: hypothetical protein KIG60_01295 [Caryophanon sp.]|nr:hypothetical protein [Caryophanon sp.]